MNHATPTAAFEPITSHLAAFDRQNAELADWRRLEKRVLPHVTSMSEYRVAVADGMNNAQFHLWEQGMANPKPAVILEAHRLSFENATTDAGTPRAVGQPVTFGGRQGADAWRVGVEQSRLHEEMSELLAEAKTPQDHCAALAFYHARFIGIHPFQDGNGRVGRSVMQAQANVLGQKFDMRHLSANKEGYIAALNTAMDTNDIAPLAKMVADATGVEWKHKGELVASSRINCRPMMELGDIKSLEEERAMVKTGMPLPLPSVRGRSQDLGRSF